MVDMVNMKERKLDTNNVKWPLQIGADYLVDKVDFSVFRLILWLGLSNPAS